MGTKVLFLFALATFFPASNLEYIPPGPAYPCPKDADRQPLFPCVCVKGTDAGIHVVCENTGLAAISVGLGNIAALGLPIELLRLNDCKIARLFGPLFARSTVHALHISRAPLTHIDAGALRGLGRPLRELYLSETRLAEFPGDALKELGNLTTLRIDGHQITTLGKDIFAGSAAAGRLERLHIVNGLISDVSPEAFQNLKKLKTLDLHGNRLVTLKRSQFKGLRDTEVLDISHNNITKLDGSHIGDLTKLGWCNASHNAIADIPRGMFARNTIIKVVHLDNNKIKKLDTNSFRGMRFLRRLFLQDNQISDVGRGTFSAVTRIGTVDLARNKITKVDYQMFQQVKYAELINLAENQISIVETQAFTDLYLAVVNISHNQLAKIEGGAFVNCNNMTVLDLSYNNLTEISKGAFDENTYAFELQVSYNAFTDFGQIPIQNMTGIRILNASHNAIEKIPRAAFPKLYELHTVDVSHNQLKEIFNAVFQNLFSLRFLNLSHNAMSVIKPGTFGTLPTVLDLDLSHNQLRDVAKGSLAKLASCRRLDVSWNQLETIFQIPISVGEVNLAHNALKEVPANTWPTMNALLYLNLSSNMLEDNLSSDSFAGLLTLQKLDLSNNGVTRPPWQALNSMTSVQYLYMQNNNLTSLSKAAFGHLPTIFRLDLSNNQLTEIDQLSFKGLLQLIELSLRNNQLESIPNEAFKTLVSLQKLDLSHNALEKIDNKTNGLLDDCLSLEMVNLSHNNFVSLTKKMFPSNIYIPYKLYEIDLSHNRLPVLTMDITHGTKKLRRLNLSYNGISDIRSYVLGNLTSLQVLDLSGNNLVDLISRTSQDPRLVLPENITELHLQDNSLQVLPVDHIVNATKLKVLDVRNNVLTSFEAKLVKKMHSNGLEVYFEGNQLKCDCNTRALKHYLNRLPPKQRSDAKYLNLTCTEPMTVQNENLLSLDEERLVCPGNTTDGRVEEEDGNTEKELSFDLVTEPDLAFRLVQFSQPSIYVHWYVVTTEDIADTYLYIRDDKNKLLYETEVAYSLRSVTITVDDAIKMALEKGGKYDICIQGKNSLGFARKWFPNQCRPILPDYASWPKKLTIDKRRLTKKKVKYSWFGRSSVLGLVSDSILITLCIFLGVFFRRLSDFEL